MALKQTTSVRRSMLESAILNSDDITKNVQKLRLRNFKEDEKQRQPCLTILHRIIQHWHAEIEQETACQIIHK